VLVFRIKNLYYFLPPFELPPFDGLAFGGLLPRPGPDALPVLLGAFFNPLDFAMVFDIKD
jgi:hypothetical protein